ncbi:SsgA family sporulation/cell division regulator [Streptomyces sp. NPDC006173]|uniref:SsgA family sporulation/cell division regulator n=1 Tax=Streptomyces sp. NPDC006173 TaxID=3155349 RepID=UPI0033CF6010
MFSFISVSLRQTDPFPFTYLQHAVTLTGQDRVPVRLGATLKYSAESPFAVVMVLHAAGQGVEWHLSREQLLAGLHKHEGWGDVAVWPVVRWPGEDMICIRLAAASEGVVVEITRSALLAWLGETLRLIPRGSEPDYLCLDQVISGILHTES